MRDRWCVSRCDTLKRTHHYQLQRSSQNGSSESNYEEILGMLY